ncbi:hypothetical protein STXM2123_4414 [Streptomyces sp. F-3]|nr:hypothetical protein STXM2123_4414 [Streptomyces sp. F-3]
MGPDARDGDRALRAEVLQCRFGEHRIGSAGLVRRFLSLRA